MARKSVAYHLIWIQRHRRCVQGPSTVLGKQCLRPAYVIVAVMAIAFSTMAHAQLPESSRVPLLWLCPLQPVVRSDGAHGGSVDFMQMFAPNAAWTTVAKQTTVFKIYPELLRGASDADLLTLINWLKEKHIALGLEIQVLTKTASCEPGANHKPWMVGLIARLKRLGGDLQQLAMVGPLTQGHIVSSSGACRSALSDVAADAAETIAMIRKLYPDLAVGEIEPVGSGPNFPDALELGGWFDAIEHATGRKLSFLHADTVWGTAWEEDLREVAEQSRRHGIPFGVIYKGDPTNLSDAEFAKAALRNADAVEKDLGGQPDQVIIQSWQDYPRRALPESDPTTLTGIALYYLRPRSFLIVGNNGHVQLLGEDRLPIRGAKLYIDVDSRAEVHLQSGAMNGFVPHSARSARFILRIHTECVCRDDQISFQIGDLKFQQPGVQSFDSGTEAWGTPDVTTDGSHSTRINVGPSEKKVLNGDAFPVRADQPFHATFTWYVNEAAAGNGLIGVVFLSDAGREIRRTTHTFSTSWQRADVLKTDDQGIVQLPPIRAANATHIRLQYLGDNLHKPTDLTVETTRHQ